MITPRRTVALVILRHAADGLLVSGGQEPHMTNMTSREDPQNDPSHAAAISRWDDEGGPLRPIQTKNGPNVSLQAVGGGADFSEG